MKAARFPLSPGQAQILGSSSLLQLISTVSEAILLVFLKSLILFCTGTIARVSVMINALTNAALCLSNLEIREAANSEDQTLHPLPTEMLGYNISETTGLLIHQIHTPYSINHEQLKKSSGGI